MKAKFGAIVVAGSGKVGGHVFSKNRGGAYMRTKVTPNNPNTVAQQQARAVLSSLSTAWAELADAERLSWNGAVDSYKTTDIFGDLKNPSGFNLFVKLNANLALIGESLLTEAPAKIEVPFAPIASAILDLSSSTLTVTFANNDLDSTAVFVTATPALSQGISNTKSFQRGIGYNTVTASAVDMYAEYVAKFGIPAIGSNITIGIEPIVLSGQKGVRQTVKVSVVA